MARTRIAEFGTIQKLLAFANVAVYVSDTNGESTGVLATLYQESSGSDTRSNPQQLDENGKLTADCWVEDYVMAEISNITELAERSIRKIRANPIQYPLPVTSASVNTAQVDADAAAAAASAATATTQAGIATTQAGIATTQASNAATSASTATTQATNAATSATNAQTARTGAEAAQVAAEAAAAMLPLNNYTATTNPTANDDSGDGYSVGSKWVNTSLSPREAYMCLNASLGAAVWVITTLDAEDLGSAALLNTGTTNGTIPLIGSGNKIPSSVVPISNPYGFNVSNNVSDATNDIDFSAGGGWLSENNLVVFPAGSALTKRLDASWAAGNNQGGLFSGSKANSTTYYLFAIYDPTNNLVDFGFDTSVTAVNRPVAYTEYVWLGMVRTSAGGVIAPFNQDGDTFYYDDQYDFYAATIGTTWTTLTLTYVPVGRPGQVFGAVGAALSGTVSYTKWRPVGSSGNGQYLVTNLANANRGEYQARMWFDASAQFQLAGSAASHQVSHYVGGFICKRGRI